MRTVLTFLAFVLAVCLTACSPNQNAMQSEPMLEIGLTKAELVYLAEHPSVRYVAETSRPPYMFEQNGVIQGMSQDYLDLITKKLGLKFVPIKFKTYAEGLDATRERAVELITSIRRTPTREVFLVFSTTYSLVGGVIVTRDALHPNTVGITKNSAVKDWVNKEMHAATLVEFPNDSVCITNLSQGSIDSCVMDLASYLWIKPLSDYPLNVEAIGYDYPFHFAALKGQEDLIKILNKALATITPEERAVISKRWIKTEPQTAALR